jgi:uncharacterized protein YciU (UPF0263 family)
LDEEADLWQLLVILEVRNDSTAEMLVPTKGFSMFFEPGKVRMAQLTVTWTTPVSSRQEPIILPESTLGLVCLRPGEVTELFAEVTVPKRSLKTACRVTIRLPPEFARYKVEPGKWIGELKSFELGKLPELECEKTLQ